MVLHVNEDLTEFVGKTMTSVLRGGSEMIFASSDGSRWKMFHQQDCCESVSIEDICGDLDDLIGSPILLAEESSSRENPLSEYDESFRWTFYKFATAKGHVTIRWYGSSNGYYSESVDIEKISNGES